MINNYEDNSIILLEKNQHKIWGGVGKDTVMGWYSALVMVEEPDGTVYEPVRITKDKLIRKGIASLDFLYRYGAGLNEDDLKIVKNNLIVLFGRSHKIIEETNDKATRKEVCDKLAEYIRGNAKEITSIDGKMYTPPDIFIKENFGYIHTTAFPKFISLNKDMGWNRLEVLKMLKRCGLLNTGKNRPYDKKVKINGHNGNYYVVKLQDENGNLMINDEVDETINIKKVSNTGEKNE